MTKITIVTPAYNAAKYIDRTIQSVLNQTEKDFKYIIINDGSTDNTEEIISKYLSDSRILYIKQANQGESASINIAWKLCNTEYFTIISADDTVYPIWLQEMQKVLDSNPKMGVAFSNAYIIDENDNIIDSTRSQDWNFIENLKAFSCTAAVPGAFFRKSSFKQWQEIRDTRFKFVADLDMLWNMALEADFIFTAQYLTSWRSSEQGISHNRHHSIPELKVLFKEYFANPNLPEAVVNIKPVVSKTLVEYFKSLINRYELDELEKENSLKEYENYKLADFSNLQIGDNDLMGNKFNGHDLHLYLQQHNIESTHLIANKALSNDSATVSLPIQQQEKHFFSELEKKYNVQSLLYPYVLDIINSSLFQNTDVVHLHLIHNDFFNLQMLPTLTALKPTIWTIHDPWILSGHCIHHSDCNRWRDDGCGDCPNLDIHFALTNDNTALNYIIKKEAIANSQIEFIVASQWMKNKLQQSEITKHKTIHLVPFGINHNIFKPADKEAIKKELGIDNYKTVIFMRYDTSAFKGSAYLDKVIEQYRESREVVFLVVGSGELSVESDNIKRFGWMMDDLKLVKFYQVADLLLMPSLQESFGMMAIEAMSCGVLPIVIDGTSLVDVVAAEHNCGVCTARDMNDYLKSVNYYINNQPEREARAQNCLQYAIKHYNYKDYVNKIINIYKNAISKHNLSNEYKFVLQQLKKYHGSTNLPVIDLPPAQDSPPAHNIYRRKSPLLRLFYPLYRPILKKIHGREKIKRHFDKKYKYHASTEVPVIELPTAQRIYARKSLLLRLFYPFYRPILKKIHGREKIKRHFDKKYK